MVSFTGRPVEPADSDWADGRLTTIMSKFKLTDEQRKDVGEVLSDDDADVDQALRIVQEAAEGNRSMI